MDASTTTPTEPSLEGRLIAHRKLLARLVAQAPDGPALAAWLDERAAGPDGQEDPGAVPTRENALLLAQADEMRLIAAAAREGEADV